MINISKPRFFLDNHNGNLESIPILLDTPNPEFRGIDFNPNLDTEYDTKYPKVETKKRLDYPKRKANAIGESLDRLFSIENILFFAIFAIIILIKFSFFSFTSGDYNGFLQNWIKAITTYQAQTDSWGFEIFGKKFANYDYTPAYVYFLWIGTVLKVSGLIWIKTISLAFEVLLSYFAAKIVVYFKPKYFKYVFLTVFALPAVVFNGSWWGQCDVIYASFVLACLYYLLRKKYLWSFVLFGVAISFKLQAVFFAPVFVILFFTKNLRLRTLVLLPIISFAVYFVTILPAFLMGRTLLDVTPNGKEGLLTIYFNQGNAWKGLAMGAIPSIYQWFDNEKYNYFYFGGVMFTIAVLLFFCLLIHKSKFRHISDRLILKIALISTLMTPFLLPKMHERYMYLAEILAVVYAFVFPKKFWVGVVISIISLSIYVSGVIGGPIPNLLNREFNTLWVIGILTYLLWDVIKNKDA